MPESPKGWLSWAASVNDSYHRAFSLKLEPGPKMDRRLNDSRETAISIIRLLEQSANGNFGASLVFEFYVNDQSWHSFTYREQRVIAVTARFFARRLREEGFLPGKG